MTASAQRALANERSEKIDQGKSSQFDRKNVWVNVCAYIVKSNLVAENAANLQKIEFKLIAKFREIRSRVECNCVFNMLVDEEERQKCM